MKKIICLVMALVIMSPVILRAEEAVQSESAPVASQGPALTAPEQGMCKCQCNCPCCTMCRKKGGMGGGMCPMMMGKASMIASQDGGVIVLVANKLQKYNMDLNLVKETEIKMPKMGGMQGPMMEQPAMEAKVAEPMLFGNAVPAEEAKPAESGLSGEAAQAEEAKSAEDVAAQQL